MKTFQVMLTNWWTSILGFLAGFTNYLVAAGAKVPETRQEWGALLFSALLAGLGLTAKSATTGSKP